MVELGLRNQNDSVRMVDLGSWNRNGVIRVVESEGGNRGEKSGWWKKDNGIAALGFE